MNFTCLCGLVIFAHQAIRYKSCISFSIFTNGVLYHSNPTNGKYRKLDIIANFLYICYVVYNEQRSRQYAIFGVCSYILNTKYKSELIHVYGVQFPLSLGLEEFLETNKNKNMLLY